MDFEAEGQEVEGEAAGGVWGGRGEYSVVNCSSAIDEITPALRWLVLFWKSDTTE